MVARDEPGARSPIRSCDRMSSATPVSSPASAAYASFLAGLQDQTVIVAGGRTERCIQIDFTPLGVRRLLMLPMDSIANRTFELDELRGPAATQLAEQLDEASTWQ